jgi:hypothetical protein
MTQFILGAHTTDLINIAIHQGPGQNNINYLNAYNAVYADIKGRSDIDSGTFN